MSSERAVIGRRLCVEDGSAGDGEFVSKKSTGGGNYVPLKVDLLIYKPT